MINYKYFTLSVRWLSIVYRRLMSWDGPCTERVRKNMLSDYYWFYKNLLNTFHFARNGLTLWRFFYELSSSYAFLNDCVLKYTPDIYAQNVEEYQTRPTKIWSSWGKNSTFWKINDDFRGKAVGWSYFSGMYSSIVYHCVCRFTFIPLR